jgi:hypothetical protein
MVDVDFTPRLVYYAVEQAAQALEEPLGPGYYQETNPALVFEGEWQPTIEPQASAQAHVLSQLEGSTVTLTFVGENADLIASTGPEGGRLGVSLDGHAVDDLPRNGQGQSYVDLFSPVRQWQRRVPVIYQADDAEHTLVLTVLERANLASEGNLIAIDAFEITRGERTSLPYAIAALLVLAVLVLGGLAFREWRLLRRG